MIDSRLKYALPRAENILRIVMRNIVYNLRGGNSATITLAPLMQRAYNIVNETGVVTYKDYTVDTEFLPEQ